jgi:hypothetical protein
MDRMWNWRWKKVDEALELLRMPSSPTKPVPKNLRDQLIKRISEMDDQSLTRLYDLDLLVEKMRLREVMSNQAEGERAAGKWNGVTEAIREYRARNRGA